MKKFTILILVSIFFAIRSNANSLQIINLTTYTFTNISLSSYDPLNPGTSGCSTMIDIVPGTIIYQDPSVVPGSSCPASYKFQGIYGFCNPIDIAVQTPDYPFPPVQSTQDFPAGTACYGGAAFTMQFNVNLQGDGVIIIW